MIKKRKIMSILIIFIVIGVSFGIFDHYFKQRIQIKGDFQNPFEFNNGTFVQTPKDWEIRRGEIIDLMMDIPYGNIPDHPEKIISELISTELRSDGSLYNSINLTIIRNTSNWDNQFTFTLDLYVPEGEGPFPAIVKVSKDGQGTQVTNNQTITSAGYIYACFDHTDLDPDKNNVVGPAQSLYSDYDWATISVWAWGAMRVADFLLNEPWVDSSISIPEIEENKLIITGHSRRGKTALLAGALDKRFDLVAPNGGCAGGAASYLVLGPCAESLGSITSSHKYPYWFHKDFGDYGGKEADLPFDQHFLRALVAPRAIISTDGIDDLWANPIGVQAVYEAAQPIFDFLGVSDNNAIHFRDGGHGFLEEDFNAILGFANKSLYNIDNNEIDFYMTPFDVEFPIKYQNPE